VAIKSLWTLNFGQRLIFTSGMTFNLILGVYKLQQGTVSFQGLLTTGDIILLQALMLQVMAPLNFLG